MWRGSANMGDGGAFSHCSISATYPNGVTVYFANTDNDRFGIAFARDDWHLTENTEHRLHFAVDDDTDYATTALAIRFDMIGFTMPDTGKAYALFKSSPTLVVDTLGEHLTFPLTGISPALDALRDCYLRHKGQHNAGSAARSGTRPNGGAANPFVPAERGDTKSNAAPATDGDIPGQIVGKLEPNNFLVGPWLGAFYPDSGPRGLCAIVAVYDGGRSLYFGLDRGDNLTMSIHWPGAGFRKGQRQIVALRLDDKRFGAHATATSDDVFRLDRSDTPQVYDSARNASVLTVEVPGAQTRFRLVAMAAAFDALRNCVKAHAGAATAGSPNRDAPSSNNPFVPPRDAAPETPENHGGSNPFAPRRN
jgi:hypothetical protein